MQHNIRLMSLENGYYANMESVIAKLKPGLWGHGHTHISGVYDITGMPVISNARAE